MPNSLGKHVWFRGVVPYSNGYHVILDATPRNLVQPMQGVGIKPIARPKVPTGLVKGVPVKAAVKTAPVKTPAKLPVKTAKTPSKLPVKTALPIKTPAKTGLRPVSPKAVAGSPKPKPNSPKRLIPTKKETPKINPGEIPKILPTQLEHYERVNKILSGWHAYLDTSPLGAGKTYVTCAIAKAYKLTIVVIAPLTLLSKWNFVADQFRLEKGEIFAYASLRGTKRYQPNTDYLRRIGDVFEVTEVFEEMVRKGILLVFDEVQALKNETTSQLKAAATLVRHIAEANEAGTGNSRIALLSASPADKEHHAESLVQMLAIQRDPKLYEYNNSTMTYVPTGLNEIRTWCNRVNPNLTTLILNERLNRKSAISMTFQLVTKVVLPVLNSAMPKPELKYGIDYKNGFLKMPQEELRRLQAGILALRMAIRRLKVNVPGLGGGAAPAAVEREAQQILAAQVDVGDLEEMGFKSAGDLGFGDITSALVFIERSKTPTAIRLAKEELEKDPNVKVILYFNYIENVNSSFNELLDFNPTKITGKMKVAERDINIAAFMRDDNDHRLMIGIGRVGSMGIDLDDKVGGHPRIMFIMPDYRFIDLFQATGRIARITTESLATVRFIYGQGEGAVETQILDALSRKTSTTKQYLANQDSEVFPGDFEEFHEE